MLTMLAHSTGILHTHGEDLAIGLAIVAWIAFALLTTWITFALLTRERQ